VVAQDLAPGLAQGDSVLPFEDVAGQTEESIALALIEICLYVRRQLPRDSASDEANLVPTATVAGSLTRGFS
jgi:hypothetical protein